MGKVHQHQHRRLHDSSGSGEDSGIENKPFHKGPWTSAEDQLLIDYVDKHGDGNWNAVQKHSGLSRCGKSCRLRWVNHLRPDLKKGAFTEKEEQRVIELHASMGNKWARMAAELPGRTDNEIKNFWNTRLKRLQRHGLPIYPDEVREQAMNAAAHQADSFDGQESSQAPDPFDIPELDFNLLNLDQLTSYYQSMLRHIPTTNMMSQRQCFYQTNNMYNSVSSSPFSPSRKRSREPETSVWNNSFIDDSHEHFSILPDNYLFGDATTTTYSSPSAEKLELPSFQCFDSPGYWGTEHSNTMPILESDNNTLFQSPVIDQTPPPSSSFCDGLLESVVYGSSGERRTTNTDSESSLLQCPTTGNKSDFEIDLSHYGSNSSKEKRKSLEGDWIRQLLGEDNG